nr:hypothetical protein Itr_chr02CG04420 [Ipomoea trifida]
MFIKLLTEKDLEGNPSLSLRLNAESLVVNSSDASAIACSSTVLINFKSESSVFIFREFHMRAFVVKLILTALRPHIRKRNQISSLWFIWCSTLTIITLSTSLQANFVEQIIRRLEICRGFNFQDLRSRGITERVYV